MLYKYRPWNEFTKSVLIEKKIFLPSRSRLNDPAELIHPIVFESSLRADAFEHARLRITSDTLELLGRLSDTLEKLRIYSKYGRQDRVENHELAKYLLISDEHWQVVEALYDRAPIHDAISYYALCLHEDAVNLYDEECSIVERLNAKLEKLGVLSLSSRSDCPVLWAHYAENHTGVVIVLNEDCDQLLRQARPISYLARRPKTNVENIVENMYRKWDSWSYEREYRAIVNRGDALHSLAPNSIVGVILGARMSQLDRKAVFDSVEGQSEIAVYQAFTDDEDYAIRYRRVRS